MSESDDLVDLFDLDLNECFKRFFGKSIIDVDLSLEETMNTLVN
jgi:hypothetical protein